MKNSLAACSLLLIAALSFPVSSTAHDLAWPGEKLKILYPQAESFDQKNLYVSDDQRSRIEKMLGSRLPEEDLKPSIYLAVVRTGPDTPPRKVAAMMFIDAYGDRGKIEMGVVVSGKGEVIKVHIFENNETPMASGQEFLKQFEGKKSSDPFALGRDIAAHSVVEKTAGAIASGARRGLVIINEMFRKK